jgi:hypothetical protein
LGAVTAFAKETNHIEPKLLGIQVLSQKAFLSQQYDYGFKETVAVSTNTDPSQFQKLANGSSVPRVSRRKIRLHAGGINAALGQICSRVIHRTRKSSNFMIN